MAKLPLVSKDDLAPEHRNIAERIEGTRGRLLNLFGTMLHSPELTEVVANLGEYLRYKSSLNPAAREIAILTVAQEKRCGYEWSHHAPEARRVGVSEEVLEAIRTGRAPMGIPAKDGVYAQAAKELMRNGSLSDRTFQAVEHLLGPGATADLIVVVGYYTTMSMLINTLEIELDEGATQVSFD